MRDDGSTERDKWAIRGSYTQIGVVIKDLHRYIFVGIINGYGTIQNFCILLASWGW